MLRQREGLPCYQRRDNILKLIQENEVIVLSGETGCGKTTQLPQMVLEDMMIRSVPAASCSCLHPTVSPKLHPVSVMTFPSWLRPAQQGRRTLQHYLYATPSHQRNWCVREGGGREMRTSWPICGVRSRHLPIYCDFAVTRRSQRILYFFQVHNSTRAQTLKRHSSFILHDWCAFKAASIQQQS